MAPIDATPKLTIGDAEPADSYDEDDHNVDWSKVDAVAAQVAAIESIDDSSERLAAAKAWAAAMAAD